MINIDTQPLEDLSPYEFNSRNHKQEQVDRIANSIQQFGFNQPIVIDESNVVLVGHGRLLAARKLGLKSVPVVRLGSLTDTQKKAYRILDNKLQNDSTWDFNNVELELGFLEDNGFDVSAWGLDELRGLFEAPPPDVEEDAGPGDTPEDPYIRRGDMIDLGRHRLVCGDATSGVDVGILFDRQPLGSAKSAAMWITDPPYGVAYVGKTKEALTIQNDALDEKGTEDLWRLATERALSMLVDGAGCYAAVPPGPPHALFLNVWVEQGIYRQQIIWAKQSLVLGHGDYHYRHEPILYGWKPGGAHFFTGDRTKTSLLEYDRPSASKEHPTMKPVALWAELISNSSKPGDRVLDSFLGSGTTLIACDQLNRSCYGLEIDPRYCQVAVERYHAHCEKLGKPFECKINGEKFEKETDETQTKPSKTAKRGGVSANRRSPAAASAGHTS